MRTANATNIRLIGAMQRVEHAPEMPRILTATHVLRDDYRY